MARRDGSFTFTYSRRNLDVKELIEQKAENEDNFVRTDYFCEAVRFYEKNKNNFGNINEEYIKNMIISILQSGDIDGVQLDQLTNQIKVSNNVDLDDVEDDWLEED